MIPSLTISSLLFLSLSPFFPIISHGQENTQHFMSGLGRTLSQVRITGDGRCLFRSVAYGACIRSGKPSPSEKHQKELADELRSKVADEFVKRRDHTEWFLEGDFESYVTQIRKPHIWGGEPELLMCCHVLRMPISVYMYTKGSGHEGPKIIAEYGQEYGKEDPIRVLYDGYGHYDVLQDPIRRTTSRS